MPSHPDTLYVTTAIPFVNARPHLGFALELCIADVLARHARARGRSVHFVSGTDDHSLKNVLSAEHAGVSTRAFVDEHAAAFRQLNAALHTSIDDFVQTSRYPRHAACVYQLWRACSERGDLYRKTYAGLYCVGCERFADPGEERCAEHAAPLEQVAEDNWFFRASRYTELLRERIHTGALHITQGAAREEILAVLRQPLLDLCVSRSATRARGWGLPVPNDPQQVIWVWFDALAYYLSALGYGDADTTRYEQFWCGGGRRLHVIGKGITRFHALFWPAILASAGVPWPSELLVHGYLTQAGAKISKSGAALDPSPWLDAFGADAVRYYLLRHVRTTRDGDISAERFVQAYNAELANGLGNLVNRTLGLVQRSHSSTVPPVGPLLPPVIELRAAALALPDKLDAAVARGALDEALAAIFELVDICNRTLDRTAPWSLVRDGEQVRAGAILRGLLEALRVIARELQPFLPLSAERLQAALGAPHADPAWNALSEGTPLPAALQLFPRRDLAALGAQSGQDEDRSADGSLSEADN